MLSFAVPLSPPKPLRLRVLSISLLCLYGSLLLPAPTQAQSPTTLGQSSQFHTLNIAPGPLAEVLNHYADQVGVSLSFDAGVLQGLQSAGVQGSVSVSEGFQRILHHSGFQAVNTGGQRYIVQALPDVDTSQQANTDDDAHSLSAVVIHGQGPEGSAPNDNYTVAASSSATGLDLSLKETPQSITTFTAQQIQDQGLLNIAEVLEQTPGITLVTAGVGGAGSQPIYSRTLPVKSITMDGVMASTHLLSGLRDGQIGTQDSFLYERIDIIRGSTSLTSGSGNPSASLNFVRKHPYYEQHLQANLKYGSWNTRRGEFDFSTPFTENGRWRGRIAAAWQKGDHWVDDVNSDRQALSLITALDITDSDTLSLGMTYNKFTLNGASPHGVARWSAVDLESRIPDYVRPPGFERDPTSNAKQYFVVENSEVGRNMNSATSWSKAQREYKNYFVSWEHIFKNDWSLRLDYNHANNEDDSLFGEMGTRFYLPQFNKASYVADRQHSKNEVNSFSAQFKGFFELFGQEQHFVIGASQFKVKHSTYAGYAAAGKDGNNNVISFRCQKADGSFTSYRLCDIFPGAKIVPTGVDIDTWHPDTMPPEEYMVSNLNMNMHDARYASISRTTEKGLYFATHLKPHERIHMIVGGRWGNLKRDRATKVCFYETSSCDVGNVRYNPKEDPGYLPYYGLILDITPSISAYGSYTTSFEGQNAQKQYSAEWQPPYKWVTKEVGLKGEFFNNRLNLAAAYFDITQKNFPWYSIHPRQEWLGDGYKVKGYELSIAGNLTPNWLITAGYVNQKQESPEFGSVRSTMLDLMDFTASYRAPQHSLKLFSSYKFNNGITLGGGLRWQSAVESDWRSPTGRAEDTRSLRQEAFTVVDVMAKYQINKNFSAQLNINNLFDKVYYQHEKSYISGAPRNYLLTASYQF